MIKQNQKILRIFIFFVLISFVFFSCKSTPENVSIQEEDISSELEEIEKNDKISEPVFFDESLQLELENNLDENAIDEPNQEMFEVLTEDKNEQSFETQFLGLENEDSNNKNQIQEIDEIKIVDEPELSVPSEEITKNKLFIVQTDTKTSVAKIWPAERIDPIHETQIEEGKEDNTKKIETNDELTSISGLPSPAIISGRLENAQPNEAKTESVQISENSLTPTPIISPSPVQSPPQAQALPSIARNSELAETNPLKNTSLVEDNKTNEIPQTQPTVQETIAPTQKTVKNQQFIEIQYPGTGWIYLGEEGNENFVSYIGRKTVNGNTVFSIKTQKPGLTRLEFYKSDPLSQTFLEDSLELIISDKIALETETLSFDNYSYENALEAPAKNNLEQNSSFLSNEPELEINEAFDIFEEYSSDMLLEKAKEAISLNNLSDAISYLDEFLQVSFDDTDEAWFLRGQTYEKPGSLRNIRLARESYQTILDAYPSSRFYKQAQDRIMYIDKFFFTIQ